MLGGTFEKNDIRTKIKIFEKKITEKNFTIISFEEDKHVNPDNTVSVWWKILVKK